MYGRKTMNEEELRRENQRLQDEMDLASEERARQRDEDEREEKRRNAERRERINEMERSADNWPEALRKQITLFSREISYEIKNPIPGEPAADPYFTRGRDACARALEIWSEEEYNVRESIAALEKQIQELRNSIKLGVANRLRDESSDKGWVSIATSLREDTPENFLNW